MANLFASPEMARGYAAARPPVHGLILKEAWRALGIVRVAGRALDVGCGSGISTRELLAAGAECVGMDPAVSMVQLAGSVAPGAAFVAGGAEQLPFADSSFELITAAGSLNYCDEARAFPELLRVLAESGWLVVYDFSPGRRMRGSRALEEWFAEFQQRYPPPPAGPALAPGYGGGRWEKFEGALELDERFYARYMMTETCVAEAVREGANPHEIRAWIEESLRPVFAGRPREVVFDGYWAAFAKPSSATTRPAP
jgi:SAM-dependent methyltransferase